jgi:hypothetical protein
VVARGARPAGATLIFNGETYSCSSGVTGPNTGLSVLICAESGRLSCAASTPRTLLLPASAVCCAPSSAQAAAHNNSIPLSRRLHQAGESVSPRHARSAPHPGAHCTLSPATPRTPRRTPASSSSAVSRLCVVPLRRLWVGHRPGTVSACVTYAQPVAALSAPRSQPSTYYCSTPFPSLHNTNHVLQPPSAFKRAVV